MQNLHIFIMFMCYMTNIVQGNSKHMICKTVEDVFAGEGGHAIPTTSQRDHGMPGKRGPQGFKGERGISGSKGEKGGSGVVNYNRINEKIEETIEQANGNLTIRVKKLEELVLELKKNASKDSGRDDVEPICNGIAYRRTCYWAVLSSSKNINLEEAFAICAKKRGKPAFIQDSQHFEQIKTYVRPLIPPSQSWVHIWLGMTINPSTRTVTLADGSIAPFVRWLSGYPDSGSSYTSLQLQVYKQSSQQHQAMYNFYPESKEHGVLCQKY
ncbi:uncharacterized protein LOC120346272 [Styela clava]